MRSGNDSDPRLRVLNDHPTDRRGRYVLYWMQQSQRAQQNHAVEHAIQRANELALPLVVGFGLHAGYPDANRRNMAFLLEGLAETEAALAARGVLLVVRVGAPDAVALALADGAAGVVCDRGYLRHQKRWRRRLAAECPVAVEQIESDVVVPVDVASPHREFAARTLRPKLQRLLAGFLVPVPKRRLTHSLVGETGRQKALGLDDRLALDDVPARLAALDVDASVAPVSALYRGGYAEARRRLDEFIAHTLPHYARDRPAAERDAASHLGMYLHYGQISPIEVALAAHAKKGEGRDSFLEELIVRRELACNYVERTDDYDRFEALPDWACATLHTHAADPRDPHYGAAEIEQGRTVDRAFNGAMREMRLTGYLPNALRMYWGKKILEWSASPEAAFKLALHLNNKYFLDGRDANSYANVAWLFGLHDRPFFDRPIFGKVRYMNAAGLDRKMDVDAYLARVDRLVAQVTGLSQIRADLV